MGRILVVSLATVASALLACNPSLAASLTISRATRSVTAEEIAGGAPIDAFVHDFFVTSSTDLLSIGAVEISAPLFQHTLGSDVSAPTGGSLLASASLAADSFITLPGQTSSVGGGFDDSPGDHAWFDASDDGPQQEALWARLTTMGQSGEFSGRVSVRGYDSVVSLPFRFALPGTEGDLAMLASEPVFTLEYSLDPPPAPLAPAPQPPVTLPTAPPAAPEPPLLPPTPYELPPVASEPPVPVADPAPELTPPAEQPFEPPRDVIVEEIIPPAYEPMVGQWIDWPLELHATWAHELRLWDGASITAIDHPLRHFFAVDGDGSKLSRLHTRSLNELHAVEATLDGSFTNATTDDFTASSVSFATTFLAQQRHILVLGNSALTVTPSAATGTPLPEPSTAGLAIAVILAALGTKRRP